MEEKLYDAIARVILVSTTDQFGNISSSPLILAIDRWFSSEKNKDLIRDLVNKTIDIDYLVGKAVELVGRDFSSSNWFVSVEANRKKLNDMVLERVADELAKDKLAELRKVAENEAN